ncbi:flagellar hook-length control protein FliK [Clostridium pasteurianum]|uniref:Flagellar hook-length control protein n=1 Tax=Clostridium pasteurianum BC1 TaxID=86416 RepID=R4KDS5_CLOPA|nr:flagellar hook-length control protein FliK [Clostridium pasteurianum]AGK97770.1 flagellar hook-length control protein [Clostridium pasteurianum BC1]
MSEIKLDTNSLLNSSFSDKGEKNISSEAVPKISFKDLLVNNIKPVKSQTEMAQKDILVSNFQQETEPISKLQEKNASISGSAEENVSQENNTILSKLSQKIDVLSKLLEKIILASGLVDGNASSVKNVQLNGDNNSIIANMDNITDEANVINTANTDIYSNIAGSANVNNGKANDNELNADNILQINSEAKEKTSSELNSNSILQINDETKEKAVPDKPISLENIYKNLPDTITNKGNSNGQVISKDSKDVDNGDSTGKLSNGNSSKEKSVESLADLESQIDNLIKNISDKSGLISKQDIEEISQLTAKLETASTNRLQLNNNLDMPLVQKTQLINKEIASYKNVNSNDDNTIAQIIAKLRQVTDLLSKLLEKTTSEAGSTNGNASSESNVQLNKDNKDVDDDKTNSEINGNTVSITNLLINFFSLDIKSKDVVEKFTDNKILPVSQIDNKINNIVNVLNNEKQNLNKNNFADKKSNLLNELNALTNDNTANNENLVISQDDFKNTSYEKLDKNEVKNSEAAIANLLDTNRQNISNETDPQENLINKIKHEIKEIIESSIKDSNNKETSNIKNYNSNTNLNKDFTNEILTNNTSLLENILTENKNLPKDKNAEILDKNSEVKIFNKPESNQVKEKIVNDKVNVLTSGNKDNSQFKNSGGFNTDNDFLKRLLEDNKDTKLDKVNTLMNQFIVQNQNNSQEIANEPKVINKSNFTADIIKSIRYMENKNIKDMTVKINPKDLGEVYIKITSSADGILKASISTNNRETFNLLNANIQDLNNNFNNSQIKIQHIDINIYNGDTTFFSNSFNQNQSNENNSHHKTYSVSNINNEEGDTLPGHIIYEDNKLNILV